MWRNKHGLFMVDNNTFIKCDIKISLQQLLPPPTWKILQLLKLLCLAINDSSWQTVFLFPPFNRKCNLDSTVLFRLHHKEHFGYQICTQIVLVGIITRLESYVFKHTKSNKKWQCKNMRIYQHVFVDFFVFCESHTIILIRTKIDEYR